MGFGLIVISIVNLLLVFFLVGVIYPTKMHIKLKLDKRWKSLILLLIGLSFHIAPYMMSKNSEDSKPPEVIQEVPPDTIPKNN